MREATLRSLSDPVILAKARETARINLSKANRAKKRIRPQSGNYGLVGEDREFYRALNKRGYKPAEARAIVDEDARRRVARFSAEMLARHRREVESRY